MKEINAIYILEQNGKPIFNHVIGEQDEKDMDQELLGGFISAIEQFIHLLGEKKAEIVELGNAKIFLMKDEPNAIIFVIKSSAKVKDKKVLKLLGDIKERFIQDYKKFLSMAPHLRVHVLSAFKKDIEEIIGVNG